MIAPRLTAGAGSATVETLNLDASVMNSQSGPPEDSPGTALARCRAESFMGQ